MEILVFSTLEFISLVYKAFSQDAGELGTKTNSSVYANRRANSPTNPRDRVKNRFCGII